MNAEIVNLLEQARRSHTPVTQITATVPTLTVDDAYAIQRSGVELEVKRGARTCGYKMGLTSLAKQRDVGVFEPIRGVLFEKTALKSGAVLQRKDFIHPRVEPEIAVILKAPLRGKSITRGDVCDALDFIGPALEIVDSRYKDFKFNLADVIADNTSAAAFMVGGTNYLSRMEEVRLMGTVVRKNGEIVETGCPAAALGDPITVVVDFIRTLAREGRELLAGEIVLTGGLTASVPFDSGDSIEVSWPGEVLRFQVK